jgi:predicted nucleic acid-binding protein
VTSAEVLQEILHLYLRRNEALRGYRLVVNFDDALGGAVHPVLREDVLGAARDAASARLQARDRLHLAVMRRLGILQIITTDRGFEGAAVRLDPLRFAEWRQAVFG